ncbi:hypothetical protein DAPPUDRAFT_58401, partial [Daphnia pulex]
KAHNDYRRKHGVPPLALDPTVNLSPTKPDEVFNGFIYLKIQVTAVAENWAKTMAARNMTGKNPVDAFYGEIKDYNFNAPGFSMKTGQFTQVVWKSSKLMGVGVAKGSNGVTYVAVNYYPSGNFVGQFAANVLPPL